MGTAIELGLPRSGKQPAARQIADAQADSRPSAIMGEQLSGAVLGAISDNHPLAGRVDGVQIREVQHGSPAWSAGLRTDDIIESVNRLPVASLDDVAAAVGRSADSLLLNVRRGNASLYILIR